jgi:hypothetical protein
MSGILYTALKKVGLICCIVFLISTSFLARAQYIITVAGNGTKGYTGDGGSATSATLNAPTSLAFDPAGNLYISDQKNHSIRKVNAGGTITTYTGTGSWGYNGDGIPANTAKLNNNWGISIDAGGNVYIGDEDNHRVRKVNAVSGYISTYAGTGTPGNTGDGGAAIAAQLISPVGVVADGAGNVYVVDANPCVVRKINGAGNIVRVAGNGSHAMGGDGGPATSGPLGAIFGIAIDNAGNLYLAEADYHRVRKVSTSGIITTVAGTGAGGYNGDGGLATAAQLNWPTGVCVSNTGEIYIADQDNHRVRKISTSGVISTVAGTGTAGFSPDGGLATSAQLNKPLNVALDGSGSLYIVDFGNTRVRKIVKPIAFVRNSPQSLNVCKDATAVFIDSLMAVRDFNTGSFVSWTLDTPPLHGAASTVYGTTSTGGVINTTGLFYIPTSGYVGVDTFKVKAADGVSTDVTTICVTVNPFLLTAGTISGPSQVCLGSTITLSNDVAGGVWSASNSSAKVVNGVVTGVVAGVDTITYTVTNLCGTVFVSRAITVNPLPAPGIILGPHAVCQGSSVTLTTLQPGGTWSSSSGIATVVPGSSSCIVTGISPGTATIKYGISNPWCLAISQHTVTVETEANPGIITGSETVCVGSSVSLANAVVGGTWSSSSVEVNVMGSIVTGLTVGTATITYSVANSCGPRSTTKQMIVNPQPVVPVISIKHDLLFVPPIYTSYQWLLNGEIIPGAVADTCFAEKEGAYALIVTNTLGCPATTEAFPFEGCSPDEMSIYPNPATTTVRIDWCQRVTVRIFGLDGKHISTQANVKEIDISSLPAGMYMVSIFDPDGKRIKTKRITKLYH